MDQTKTMNPTMSPSPPPKTMPPTRSITMSRDNPAVCPSRQTSTPTAASLQPKPEPARWRRREDADRRPTLVFSPLAWIKLMFFLHAGDTEIGGFGISAEDNLLYIEEFVTVEQRVSSVSVEFDDASVSDFFDASVDEGLKLEQFSRLWLHTHPGESPNPSFTDEATFDRVFGKCDFAVMFIIGRTGKTYARLSFSAGPRGSIQLPVAVDWQRWPELLIEQDMDMEELKESWMDEYGQNIFPEIPLLASPTALPNGKRDHVQDLFLEDEIYGGRLWDAWDGWEEFMGVGQ